MPGGMAFRRDCEECGRSFLTPDKTRKVCPRCPGTGHPKPEAETITGKGTSPKPAGKTLKSPGKSPTAVSAADSKDRIAKSPAPQVSGQEVSGAKAETAPETKGKAVPKEATPHHEQKREEMPLTESQVQEIVDRYQKYVEVLERPPIGRRKTIAAAMGLPHQRVVLALRQWNQQQGQLADLTREQRFAIEKIYFPLLEERISFLEIKARIVQETGLPPWVVSRYLDLLHDGEKKLQNVPPVSSEQETAILEEYRKYLSASGPPSAPLHPLIADRTGVLPKQVYKVLLSYRLSRFREQWG
jgi:hypothetical protein